MQGYPHPRVLRQLQGGRPAGAKQAKLRQRHDWAASDADAPSLWHELWDPRYRSWLFRATAYEFFGTLVLIYMQAASGETLNRLGLAASVNDALGHGLAAGVAVYIVVHVSGAFLNPAMTLAFWFSRRIDALTVLMFTAAQVAGSIAAAGLLRASISSLTTGLGVPRLAGGISIGGGILIESALGAMLFWFMAMLFLRSRYFWYRGGYRVHGSSPTHPALAALLAFVWNGAIEAAFVSTVGSGPNPVRWLGPAIVAGRFQNWWVWVAGPYIGALIGVALYGLDVAVFRPDRTRFDLWQQRDADRKQRERQGTRSSLAPDPPLTVPLVQDFESEGLPALL